MRTKTELTLEQTQQGVSNEVLNIKVILKYSQRQWKSFQSQHQTSSAVVDANSNRMERQMLVHFQRERDANRANAQELMRLIAEVEERTNHNVSLIRKVEILTGCIPTVEATSKLKRDQEQDIEKLKRLNEMVFKARCDWYVDDAMSDVILDDLLQKKFNEHEHVKDDKGKLTGIECVDNLRKRIQNVKKVLYMVKEKMLMEKHGKVRKQMISLA
ncbi:hypothetical protein Tco_0034112 [Tanacetum coccineum]